MGPSHAEIAAKVITIIAAQAMLSPGDVGIDASPDDLGLDSLGLVESIFAIEEAFDIAVPFNANDPTLGQFDIASVGSIIAAVERLIREKAV